MFIDVLGAITAVQEYRQVVGEDIAVIKTKGLRPFTGLSVNELQDTAIVEKSIAKIKTGKGCDLFWRIGNFHLQMFLLSGCFATPKLIRENPARKLFSN